jgi:hypothetical protein
LWHQTAHERDKGGKNIFLGMRNDFGGNGAKSIEKETIFFWY